MNAHLRLISLALIVSFVLFVGDILSEPSERRSLDELNERLNYLNKRSTSLELQLNKAKKQEQKTKRERDQIMTQYQKLSKEEETLGKRLDILEADLSLIESDILSIVDEEKELVGRQYQRLREIERTEPLSLFDVVVRSDDVQVEDQLILLLQKAQQREHALGAELLQVRAQLVKRRSEEQFLFQEQDRYLKDMKDKRLQIARLLDDKKEAFERYENERKRKEKVMLELQAELLELESLKQDLFASYTPNSRIAPREKGVEFSSSSHQYHSIFRKKYLLDWPLVGAQIKKRFQQKTESKDLRGMKNGVLLISKRSNLVTSIADGEVHFVGKIPFYGETVIVGHATGEHSLYGRLKSVEQKIGDSIRKGAVLGKAFQEPSGAVLYFELRKKTKAIDPTPYFSDN